MARVKRGVTTHARHRKVIKAAKGYREWLQSLQIDPKLRDPLAEPIEAIEQAFADLIHTKET